MKKIYTIIFIILISLTITGCNKEKEVIVEDVTIEYDGNYHKIVPQNITDDMEYYYIAYDENEFRDVGEYEFIIEVYDKGEFHGMYEAILTIIPKQIYIIVDDAVEEYGKRPKISYEVRGIIPGDELGEYLGFDSEHNVDFTWENKNYFVNVIGGKYTIVNSLVNTIDLYENEVNWDGAGALDPSLAPFAFENSSLFENRTITSISFYYGGLNVEYDYEKEELYVVGNMYLPIYIIDSSYTTLKSDCTVENGRKVLIDITEYVEGKDPGDIITISGLNIKVKEGQTLAFGDDDMALILCSARNEEKYHIFRNVFDERIKGRQTLLIKVDGYY